MMGRSGYLSACVIYSLLVGPSQAFDTWEKKDKVQVRSKEAADLLYVKHRYERGLRAVEAHAKECLNHEFVGEELEDGGRVAGEAANALAKLSPGHDTYILFIYDGSVHRSAEHMEGGLKLASALLHQDPRHGLLFLLPQLRGGLASETVIKHSRQAEDRMMSHGLELSGDVAVTYGHEEVCPLHCRGGWT